MCDFVLLAFLTTFTFQNDICYEKRHFYQLFSK